MLSGTDPDDMMSVGPNVFLKRREVSQTPKKFACLLASNPHPIREQIVNALGKLAEVDLYGRAFGRPVQSKSELIGQYRFCVAPENDLYPGYVTEKPFEAWLAQAVPIWWGTDSARFLNKQALLNSSDRNLDALVDKVAAIEADPNEWLSIVNAPILARQYDYDALIEFVAKRIR